jgi:hypothetical protein
MCNWCASHALCQPNLDGRTAACSRADSEARNKSLDALRENREDLAAPPEVPRGSLHRRPR